jgi:hypothetical protein
VAFATSVATGEPSLYVACRASPCDTESTPFDGVEASLPSCSVPSNTPFAPFSVTTSPPGSVFEVTVTLTEDGPALVSVTRSSITLLEPYCARSSARMPAFWPTPPVTHRPKGWGPTGTVGAATRIVHRPAEGTATVTSSSVFRMSVAPPVTDEPPVKTLPL